MQKRHLVNLGVNRNKIITIPNGLTLPPMDINNRKHVHNKTILCLARLDIDNKGQDILLNAMPKVLSQVPEVKLWVVGEGRDLEKLKRLVTKLKLNSYVEFKGRIDDSAKFFCMKNSQVLCVPTRTESFGIVNLEAMAYGLPIVTTNVGGIPEVVGDSAFLVPPNNPSALANALIQILNDDTLANDFRKKGLKRVKRFDWDALVKKYEKLYEEM